MWRLFNSFRNLHQLSVQLKFLEKKSTKHMFSDSDNLYNLKSTSLRLIVAINVNLTNLATRKHGSEADFLIMGRVNIVLKWCR